MKILIVGGGIGGLATDLSLHHAGIDVEIFEQAHEIRELGVGINVQPHAVRVLTGLGLLPALEQAGIRTRELIYCNRFGQTVWNELRGADAGYDVPQFSIHRGKLLGVLHQAAVERLGPARIHTACRLVGFEQRGDRVVASFERNGEHLEVSADALIGADGIHSTVRSFLYPREGTPDLERHHVVARRGGVASVPGRADDGDRRRKQRQVRLVPDPRRWRAATSAANQLGNHGAARRRPAAAAPRGLETYRPA